MRQRILSALCACTAVAATAGPSWAQTAAPTRMPFPETARIAFVNPQYVFSASREGKVAATEIQQLQNKKAAAINAKTKEVQALEQKLTQGGAVLNADARIVLQREIARAKVDFQRLVEDAEAEVQELRHGFERAFSRKLFPAIGEVAEARNLWAVFSADANVLWQRAGLDISDEVLKRVDGSASTPPAK